MTPWASPLKLDMVVECTDGLIVKILGDPIWKPKEDSYEVKVRVMSEGSSYPIGKELDFFHMSPGRFGGSFFKFLHLPGTYMTLEDEYFGRVQS